LPTFLLIEARAASTTLVRAEITESAVRDHLLSAVLSWSMKVDQVRRRDFIAAVSGAAIAWPLTGLIGAGFVEGHTLSIEFRWQRVSMPVCQR